MEKEEPGYVLKPKGTAKDTVFTNLFKEKEYLLQLYQALAGRYKNSYFGKYYGRRHL